MSNPPPDLPALLDPVRRQPARGFGWLALAAWLCRHGRHDEADAVRVFWPRLSARVQAGQSVHTTLRAVARDAAGWGQRARQVEQRRRDQDHGWGQPGAGVLPATTAGARG
jgi:hypothetical protein